jgi:hypothetical protein
MKLHPCLTALLLVLALMPTTPAAADDNSPSTFTVETVDGQSKITFDTTAAPELRDWAQNKLAPVLEEWYPKIVAILPSDGFVAPDSYTITLKPMDGVAYTTGTAVFANKQFLQNEIHGQAIGALVHESVHVVQQFGRKGYSNNGPGWFVEGTADYIRWFMYEPQSHGADLDWMRHQNFKDVRYDGSYRFSANFLDWVSGHYDKDIVDQVTAAIRNGKYTPDTWKQYTGKTAPELGAEWRKNLATQLGIPPDQAN